MIYLLKDLCPVKLLDQEPLTKLAILALEEDAALD